MRAEIELHGGTVEKFIGDAVMAVFGIPSLHEDDALRAVRAADGMRESLEPLNKDLERDFGVRLASRIGVNTGEVLVGPGSTDFGRVTGDAVNTAARLETAAQPGEVLIGADTYRLVRDAVDVESVEPRTVKGKAEPVECYRLVGVLAGTAAPPRAFTSPIVGRERELEDLERAFERSIAGPDVPAVHRPRRRRCREVAPRRGVPGSRRRVGAGPRRPVLALRGGDHLLARGPGPTSRDGAPRLRRTGGGSVPTRRDPRRGRPRGRDRGPALRSARDRGRSFGARGDRLGDPSVPGDPRERAAGDRGVGRRPLGGAGAARCDRPRRGLGQRRADPAAVHGEARVPGLPARPGEPASSEHRR